MKSYIKRWWIPIVFLVLWIIYLILTLDTCLGIGKASNCKASINAPEWLFIFSLVWGFLGFPVTAAASLIALYKTIKDKGGNIRSYLKWLIPPALLILVIFLMFSLTPARLRVAYSAKNPVNRTAEHPPLGFSTSASCDVRLLSSLCLKEALPLLPC